MHDHRLQPRPQATSSSRGQYGHEKQLALPPPPLLLPGGPCCHARPREAENGVVPAGEGAGQEEPGEEAEGVAELRGVVGAHLV